MAVEFRLLGDIEARVDERPVAVGHARQQCVLAALLVDAGRSVPADQLIDRVWGERAPQRARGTLHTYLARLRRALAVAGVDIVRRPAGYLLDAEPLAVDTHRFHRLLAQARSTDDDQVAAGLVGQALELWQGPALAGLDTPWCNMVRAQLDRERWAAELDSNDLALRLGRHSEVLAGLVGAAAAHPLDERLAGQWMLALYRSGRQAEALEVYQQARAQLAEELGIEPGPQLQHLQRAVLSADPALAPPAPTTALSGRLEPSWAPCLLPSDAAGFTGREWELAWLDRLTASDAASTAAVVGLISGTPGVGKTGLALHWAHRAQQNFPDGQLYVNLRGYDPEKPMTAGEALARLLAALGLRGQDVPLDVEERAARYRSELSGRRMLVVLDNANSAGQVRSLLPGTATCATLVTSRDALPGLVALHGAHRLVLDLLPADDARTLLRRLIGPRVDAESQAAATLAELCQRLPLTLRLAAELAAARPHHSLAALATELADQHRRLDLLDADEDIGVGVRAVFSWSYQRLPAPAARAFRLLALHPGTDWDAYATAALTDTGPHPARRLLDRLARAHLIEPTGPDRYTMHDLLRAYAAELAATTDPEPDRQVALTRLFDHYLATAITATAFLGHYSGKWRPRLLRAAPLSRASPVGDSAGARAWLDAERPNLTLVCAHAARHGWHEHAQDLAAILFRYLGTGGHYADALAIHTHAHQAARRQGDRHGAAYALTHLSSMYWRQGHYRQAVDHGRRALESFRRVGDRSGEAHALLNLCLVYWRQGHYRQAVDHGRRALESFRRVGDRSGEGYARLGLGLVHWRQGDYGRAVEQYRRALDLFRRLGDQSGRAYALTCQGLVDWRQGDHGRAVEQHRRALDLFRRLGDRAGQAEALTHLALVDWRQGDHGRAVEQHRRALDLFQRLGDQAGQAYTLTHLALVHCRQGNRPRAMEQHRRALDLARQTGYRAVEAEALNGLGETLQMSGQAVQARTWHADALAMAEAIGDRYEQARAHQGIAATHHTTNDLHLARRHWQDALSLYCDLGVPEADTIRAQLSALTHQNINPPAPP